MISRLAALQIILVPLALAPAAFAGPSAGKGGSASSDGAVADPHSHVNLLTGEGVSLGGVLFPHIHAAGVYGNASGDQGELATAHHDPSMDGWTVQSIEAGFSLRLNDHLEGFATGALRWDDASGWSEDFEEGFLKLKDLPGGLELRGGQYFNRFGLQNSIHQHGWDWVDQYLVSGRFFGEHGLASIGGELTWELPLNSNAYTSLLSFSLGEAPQIAHGEHGEEEEEGEEPEFEGEGALFNDLVFAANWTNIYRHSDFHSVQAGLSGAWGDNAWGRDAAIYGLHAKYKWRENGLQPGGRELRWSNELFYRTFDAVSGHLPGEEESEKESAEEEAVTTANLNEFGFYSSLVYAFDPGVAGPMEIGLRAEYVQGIDRAGQEERLRISPGLTWYLNDARSAYTRMQYNYDDGAESGESHGFWVQFGLNWGGAEVR